MADFAVPDPELDTDPEQELPVIRGRLYQPVPVGLMPVGVWYQVWVPVWCQVYGSRLTGRVNRCNF